MLPLMDSRSADLRHRFIVDRPHLPIADEKLSPLKLNGEHVIGLSSCCRIPAFFA